MSNRDKEKVLLICKDCGCNFEMSFGRYRRLPKDNHWRCKKCTNIKRSLMFVNLTDEERIKLREQRSSSAKKSWQFLTVDEYMRRCKSQQERWRKLSDEEKAKIMKNTHEGHKIYIKYEDLINIISDRFKSGDQSDIIIAKSSTTIDQL